MNSAVRPDWKEKLLRYKYIWLALLLAALVTVVSCALFLPPRHLTERKQDVELPNNYTLRLRTRPEWFSLKPEIDCKNLSTYQAKYILVAHTVTTNCAKQINCENVIKGIQSYHLSLKFCDIAYNFIIAGDGFIYEGIGWGKSGRHTKGFNCDSIGVAFLGNYDLQHSTAKMEEAFHLLIEEGLKLNTISSEYKLLEVNLPRNYTQRIRARSEWLSPTTETNCNDLLLPAKFVIVAHTQTTHCGNQFDCESIIKSIQNYNIKQDHCDINYNFIIAGDGYIYEGVGWGKQGTHTSGFDCNSIGIAFLGNYDQQYLTDEMEEAFHILIEEGLMLNQISPDYKLFGQYQVNALRSPGQNVQQQMKHWQHWCEAKKEDRMCNIYNNKQLHLLDLYI